MRVSCGPTASIDNLEESETYTREQGVDAIPSAKTQVDFGGQEESSSSIDLLFAGLGIHDVCMLTSSLSSFHPGNTIHPAVIEAQERSSFRFVDFMTKANSAKQYSAKHTSNLFEHSYSTHPFEW